jgi:outer membrane PBP1 activator LpoA protein
MSYATADVERKINVSGRSREVKIARLEFDVTTPVRDDHDITEVHIVVNGRIINRMNPHLARQLGLLSSE